MTSVRNAVGGTDTHDQLAELCEPLIDAMKQDAFEQPYLCVDATGVLVQQKEKCRRGHFWVLVAPGKHALFRFSSSHDRKAVEALLGGYEGTSSPTLTPSTIISTRAATSSRSGAGRTAGATSSSPSPPIQSGPKKALGLLGALFHIERSIADAPRKQREAVRNAKSRPIVEQFFDWCVILGAGDHAFVSTA